MKYIMLPILRMYFSCSWSEWQSSIFRWSENADLARKQRNNGPRNLLQCTTNHYPRCTENHFPQLISRATNFVFPPMAGNAAVPRKLGAFHQSDFAPELIYYLTKTNHIAMVNISLIEIFAVYQKVNNLYKFNFFFLKTHLPFPPKIWLSRN